MSVASSLKTDEAELIWDEFKYRHDLIWRHLIRSTLALVFLATIRYSEMGRDGQGSLAWFGSFAALAYWGFTVATTESELRLFYEIDVVHRQRQKDQLKIEWRPHGDRGECWGWPFRATGFGKRILAYLVLLFAGILWVSVGEAAIAHLHP